MRKVRIAACILFLKSLFVSIDLGMNFLYNLVPEFLDGYTSHSILQGLFGIFGDRNWTLARFYEMFERSLWVSYILLAINVLLYALRRER